MVQAWDFIRNKNNRERLTWLGAGIVAIISGVWTVLVYVVPKHQDRNVPAVSASCGGVAVTGGAYSSTINGGSQSGGDCNRVSK